MEISNFTATNTVWLNLIEYGIAQLKKEAALKSPIRAAGRPGRPVSTNSAKRRNTRKAINNTNAVQ